MYLPILNLEPESLEVVARLKVTSYRNVLMTPVRLFDSTLKEAVTKVTLVLLQLMKKMSSTDTPLGTLQMLQDKQRETHSPYIVLQGAKRDNNT